MLPVDFGSRSQGLPCPTPGVFCPAVLVRDQLAQVVDAIDVYVKSVLRIHFL